MDQSDSNAEVIAPRPGRRWVPIILGMIVWLLATVVVSIWAVGSNPNPEPKMESIPFCNITTGDDLCLAKYADLNKGPDYSTKEIERAASLVKKNGCIDAPPVQPKPYVIDGYRFLQGWQVVAMQPGDEQPELWSEILVYSAWEQYTGVINWNLTIYGWCAPDQVSSIRD